VRAENITFDYDIEAGRDITASGGGSLRRPRSTPVNRWHGWRRRSTPKTQHTGRIRPLWIVSAELTGAFILVGEYDRLQGHLVADWLIQLVTAPEHAVVVVATRIGGPCRLSAHSLSNR
jgi:hypothetical protein